MTNKDKKNLVSAKVSRTMRAIKSKDTKPELLIRKALFKKGLRYRINVKKLPGTPDIVLPKYKAIIMVNGCFWHGHVCRYFKFPPQKEQYWKNKIKKNLKRDKLVKSQLLVTGWRVMTVWECALFGKKKHSIEFIITTIISWLNSTEQSMDICGKGINCLQKNAGILS